jgi:hypothetical protein
MEIGGTRHKSTEIGHFIAHVRSFLPLIFLFLSFLLPIFPLMILL